MANKLQLENVPDVYPFFNAYPYPYKKTTNQSEYDLATQLFAFKDFGTPSEKVRNGFVNMAKKAVISLDTLKDTVFINMPSSKGLSASQTRWGEINQTLRSNHINVLDPSALYYAKPKAEAHSVNANGKRNMEYDVLDGLVINCRDQIQGKNVVLLDDVMTTGRHLRFIGDELMKLGAKTVSEVALCCTPPKIGHDDTRYRYHVVQDDGCKRHPHKFSQTLNPLENQSQFYAIDSRERQLSIFDVLTEKEVQAVKNINPNQQMAAERDPSVRQYPLSEKAEATYSKTIRESSEQKTSINQSNNNSIIMAKENPQQPENQAAEKTMSLPKKQSLSFANISPIKKQDGTEVKTAEPRFSTTIRLGDLAAMQKSNGRVVTDKEGKEHKLLDLAIVPNTKHEEGKNSPYLVIAKRNDAPAHYNGKDVKFVDKDAVMEFTVNSAQLLAKASNLLGKKLDDTVQLHIGKNGAGSTGVSFNPGEYPTVDKKQLEIATERITTVNSFDRAIKSQQNMDKMGENRYVDKYLGSAFGFDAKDANKQTILNEKTQEPVKNFNITLKATDIKFLPEADKFGNVNLAIVKRDLSPEKLGEKGLKMTEGSDFPVNERGFKQPNYMVMADPKTYKNGEPNEHVVAVIKINKDELNQLPKTKESFTTKDGKEVNNEFIHISTDRFGQVKANVNDYKFHNVEAQDTRLTARITTYNPQIAQKERQNWEQKHPRLSEADFTAKIEREKNLPTQFDAYRQATQLMQSKPQKNEQQTSQGESQKADQQAKVYKDYSKADDANQQEQGRGKKMPF